MTETTVYYTIMFFLVCTALYAYMQMRSASKTVNQIINEAKKCEERKEWNEGQEKYKTALGIVLGVGKDHEWGVFELKENMINNGWFLLNELNRIYKIQNIEFDMTKWTALMVPLQKKEIVYMDHLPDEDHSLVGAFKNEFKKLP